MYCHECARDGLKRVAVSVCRYCSVALCKDHLVAAFRSQRLYTCDHHPERPFAPRPQPFPPAVDSVTGRSGSA